MRKVRVFYFNVLYGCNNSCRYCFSHTTNSGNDYQITKKDIYEIISLYGITDGDRVVVNGGEPLLHNNIIEIVGILACTGAEVVVYSNGTILADKKFSELFASSGFSRITIPFHGTEKIHDYITRNIGSFRRTVLGLNNLALLKQGHNFTIELKLIINGMMVQDAADVFWELEDNLNMGNVDSIVLSGMVETSVARENSFLKIDEKQTSEFALYLYKYISKNYPNIEIKIEDICIKYLKKELDIDGLGYDNGSILPQYKVIFFDKNHLSGVKLDYDCVIDCAVCLNCDIKKMCPKIEYSYRVLSFKGNWRISLE